MQTDKQTDRVILITGASRGIGAGLAQRFASAGFRVVINYSKSEDEATRLCEALARQVDPDLVLKVRANVASRREVRAMFDQAVARFGRVDALVNNAGINVDQPFLTMTDDQWQQVIDTNLTGTFICAQEFALHFDSLAGDSPDDGRTGHIVNIGASTGLRGRKNGANYCSAKAGVMTLTKCLALELAPRIRVNCVVPGYIETEELITRYALHERANYERTVSTVPAGRLGTVDDVFRAVHFLINEAEYMTGQHLFVNGGHFMP